MYNLWFLLGGEVRQSAEQVDFFFLCLFQIIMAEKKKVATRVNRLEGSLSFSQWELSQCMRHPCHLKRPTSACLFNNLKEAIVLENRGQQREVKGYKLNTCPVVEFVLKLHPEDKHNTVILASTSRAIFAKWWKPIPMNRQVMTLAHQCRRRACRKADKPSMTSRMDTVSSAKTPNTGTKNTTPTLVVIRRPRRITISHNTSDSSANALRQQPGRAVKWTPPDSMDQIAMDCECVKLRYTYARVPSWVPTVAGTKRCWRCSPGSTRWCGWPDAGARRQSQTVAQMPTETSYSQGKVGNTSVKMEGVTFDPE